jgi:Na+/melibiose symporter-like transporter
MGQPSDTADYCISGSQSVWHCWLLHMCVTSCLTLLPTAKVVQKLSDFVDYWNVSHKSSDIADYRKRSSKVVLHWWLLQVCLTSCLTLFTTARVAQSCLIVLTIAHVSHKLFEIADYCMNSTQSDTTDYCTSGSQVPSICFQLYRTLWRGSVHTHRNKTCSKGMGVECSE